MPGFVEAHGHPLMEAIALSDRLVDIRPGHPARRRRGRRRGSPRGGPPRPDGAYLNGWDPLLQDGLPEPYAELAWARSVPDDPLGDHPQPGH